MGPLRLTPLMHMFWMVGTDPLEQKPKVSGGREPWSLDVVGFVVHEGRDVVFLDDQGLKVWKLPYGSCWQAPSAAGNDSPDASRTYNRKSWMVSRNKKLVPL
jgi:hypothetical protein